MKTEENVRPGAYFRRALTLAQPEWPLLFWAFSSLIAYSAANLLLPKFQGEILDHTYNGSYKAFHHKVLCRQKFSAYCPSA